MNFRWTDEALDQIAQHGVSREEVELTVSDPDDLDLSRRSGRPMARRWFGDGWVVAVYELDSYGDVWPVTAYRRRHD